MYITFFEKITVSRTTPRKFYYACGANDYRMHRALTSVNCDNMKKTDQNQYFIDKRIKL
jgi:hypothetical protein